METYIIVLLCIASFFAGFVDAIVGGGGLEVIEVDDVVLLGEPSHQAGVDFVTVDGVELSHGVPTGLFTEGHGGATRENIKAVILGNLVGTTDNNGLRTELIVFITPKIIRNGEDAARASQDLRDKMKNLNFD